VRIVGGASPEALLRAAHLAEAREEDSLFEDLGTRVLRERLAAAQAAFSAA
jgi:hypothetical protein